MMDRSDAPSSFPACSTRADLLRLFRLSCVSLISALLFLLWPAISFAQVQRLVIVKCDGLPYEVVDQFVQEKDPRTGKSQLPWIDHIFYQRGVRLANFYVRGMSLSAPSWSLLETGQHLQIKGNVEFDRFTLHAYDYLNFFPYLMTAATGSRVDTPAVEVLDSLHLPLLMDAFPHNERYMSFSLFQRGPRFVTFQRSMENKLKQPARELFDEWTMGLGLRDVLPDQLLNELIRNLNNPKVRLLDLMLADFDHVAHHNNDRESHLLVLKQIDSVLGRIWTAIEKSPLADSTALVLVSDHGFNTDEKVYSQGYNLVKLLGSPAAGGHHVVTKRRLLLDYSIKGMNPFVPLITTNSHDSYYLKGQSIEYPTAMLDFDGNERASIHLRDSDLNLLQILLQQCQRTELSESLRQALNATLFATLDRRRPDWQNSLDQLEEELAALRRQIERQRKLWATQPKKFSAEEMEMGRDDESKRVFAQLERSIGEEREYAEYARSLKNLLALQRDSFNPSKVKIEDVIAQRAMGEQNNIYQLQHYVAGIAPGGLVLRGDGSLDLERSFVTIDYFSLLHGISVRNNVQPEVGNRPVDLIATSLPGDQVGPLLGERKVNPQVVWVYGGPDKQALIMAREDQRGMSLRYQPIKNLTQDSAGRFHFEIAPWQPGLPLHILEDKDLGLSEAEREGWLSQWHTDLEWLRVLHRTNYSNGLIGLNEELARHEVASASGEEPGISSDERLLLRFVARQRQLVEADMLLVANNHWNFDVRGFNPGGNHGSFFRISTHSTFMVAGGEKTNLPRGTVVTEPYDSLSFVPSVLALTGNLRDDSSPVPVLWEKGFRKFPGPIVKEVLPLRREKQNIAVTGATASP